MVSFPVSLSHHVVGLLFNVTQVSPFASDYLASVRDAQTRQLLLQSDAPLDAEKHEASFGPLRSIRRISTSRLWDVNQTLIRKNALIRVFDG